MWIAPALPTVAPDLSSAALFENLSCVESQLVEHRCHDPNVGDQLIRIGTMHAAEPVKQWFLKRHDKCRCLRRREALCGSRTGNA